MRTAFIETLTELAERDERVWLLTGDLGFSVFEGFRDRFPDRYLNVGVAEQDLMGIAAGLALLGKRPFVYSITTFATMRAYEQIRDDICYQNLPVIIIGGGSTFSYSTFGATHMPLEDVALMRVLPHMNVTTPGDPYEVRALLKQLHAKEEPGYMRIAKKGEPFVHEGEAGISLGTPTRIKEGTDAVLFVSGRQLPNAVAAAHALEGKGVSVRVVSVHTVKPLPEAIIIDSLKGMRACLVVEEHSIIGGLGDAIARILVQKGISLPYASLGVPDEFPKGVYSQDAFLDRYALSERGIGEAITKLLQHG